MPADYIRCQQNTCEVTIGMNDEGTEAASLLIEPDNSSKRESNHSTSWVHISKVWGGKSSLLFVAKTMTQAKCGHRVYSAADRLNPKLVVNIQSLVYQKRIEASHT